MGSPSSPPLTVEESDGTNSNRPVTDLKFNAADFTIAASGRSSTVSLSGSGSGASLTDTFVGFGDASNLLTGSANFIFSQGSNQQLEINQTSTGGLGTIALKEAGTTAGIFQYRGSTNGTNPNTIRIGTNVAGGNLLFMTDSATANMYIDSTGKVGIGTTSPSTPLHVKDTTTGSFLLLENVDTGGASAPDLVLYRNSTSPADGDFTGIVDFKGQDDGGSEVYYGRIASQIRDASAATHDGSILFIPARNASVDVNNNLLKLSGEEGAVFNENSLDNYDFRVESDAYQQMFFIDAGLNKAHFGTGGIDNALGLVQINVGNSTQNALTVSSADGDAAQSPTIEFYRNSASPAVQDAIGNISFTGNDDAAASIEYASIEAFIQDPVAGSQDGDMRFKILKGNVNKEYLRMNSFGVIFNELGADQNFKIESNNNANMFVVDGGTDTVAIGGIVSTDATLTIYDTNDQDVLLRLETDENSADKSPALEFYKNSAADISDYIMAIDVYGLDDGGAKSEYARIATYIEDETAATENGVMIFQVAEAGSLRSNFVIGSTLVTVNGGSRNVDFRHVNDAGSINFYSDAGINSVGIRTVPTTGLADNNPVLQVEGSMSSKCAIVTKTSATVDLSTRVSNELIGQLYVLTSASAKTLTVPTSCTQGDWFRVLTTGANGMDIVSTGGATLNGATPASLNRDAQNEIYTVVAIATDKWVCTSN